MPYPRVTLAGLMDRIGAVYRTAFPGADTNLRKSPDRAVVAVVAASTDEDLAYSDWQARQIPPWTAEGYYIERWAAAKGLAKKLATPGAGTVALSGTVGFSAVAGQQLQTDTGIVVTTTADALIGGDGTVIVAAQAAVGGANGNLGIGTRLTFVGTPAGFSDTGAVAGVFAGGADDESNASLQARFLRRFAQPSYGGNRNDWEQAALAVAGVSRVFTSAATPTPGAVTIFPLFDGLRVDGIPVGDDAWYRPGTGVSAGIGGTGDQRLVLNAVLLDAQGRQQRPVCAHVYVTALIPAAIAITIANLKNDTPTVRAAIAAELNRMQLRRAVPSGGCSLDWINEAISRAAGEDTHNLTLPAANVAGVPGRLFTIGVISYV